MKYFLMKNGGLDIWLANVANDTNELDNNRKTVWSSIFSYAGAVAHLKFNSFYFYNNLLVRIFSGAKIRRVYILYP